MKAMTLVFQITAASVESEARSINLAVSEQASNYVSELVNQIVLPADAKSVLLSLITQDNEINEADGAVTVTLEAGSSYEIASEFSSAQAIVNDNDTPLVAIRAESEVTEDQVADICNPIDN